ncbi:MAG: RecQ family ATP-dependent DNA helicase [Actinomycetota bacterium]|nr:RecQ family ATP-dependent DNA helicase [Actinomycetota bacterium]MDH5223732.1 RecQ family ATP-dependent DNA helicase [Actinomycetota bacterium]MDH5314465.1 RecQ family ATP-dependent DNA helicase [Actinomycetota bacterium]
MDAATPLDRLRQMLGADASFRPGQLDAIEAVARERGRVLLVQRTGWGKSAVYFIATKLLREEGTGPTLLVSPLLALMRNQIEMAERIGVRAETINSTNPDEFDAIAERLANDEIDLLLVSPERFANARFRDRMLSVIARTVGLLVVDEAHCISDWGHDFRPDYRRIVRVLEALPPGVPVLCTTATANDRVIADITDQLGEGLRTFRGTLDRESLALAVADVPAQAERLAWLAETVPSLEGSGIVYVLTIADSERVAAFLRRRGIEAEAYSGATDNDDRVRLEQALLANELKALVATSALGMGFDKPDLGFVVHYQSPGSPIAYYQQVGRAGRALEHAPAVLLCGVEDREIQDYFIETAFPPRDQAERIVDLLADAVEPMSLNDLMAAVNVRRGRLESMLKVLEVEGALARERGGYARTGAPWTYPADRVEHITALRRHEQEAMRRYAQHDGCLMEFLRRELDDPGAEPCGRCAWCRSTPLVVEPSPELRAAAREHLRRSDLFVEPRRQWPSGLTEFGVPKGRIAEQERPVAGRALSVVGDGGWGRLVAAGRGGDQRFADELIEASATLIGERWKPDPGPTWVTCVPSMTHPDLVPDLAERVAAALDLPFHEVVRKVAENQPQAAMRNSAQQVRNVWEAFDVGTGSALDGPVLLVDDLADSRWTITVVARALRRAGAGPVHPFVLATAVAG